MTYTSDLATRNATQFIQDKLGFASVMSQNLELFEVTKDKKVGNFSLLVAQDWNNGTKHIVVALEELSDLPLLTSIFQSAKRHALGLDADIFISMQAGSEPLLPMNNRQMALSPKLTLYIRSEPQNVKSIYEIAKQNQIHLDLKIEENMYETLFISYGGNDTEVAEIINDYLTSKGVKTWFFKRDKVPGQKLHRVMHEGIAKHEKTLLICSRNSLKANGVLNEVGKLLEREAKEGGTERIIPITLDRYIFDEWESFGREYLADALKSRVIGEIETQIEKGMESHIELDTIITSLKK